MWSMLASFGRGFLRGVGRLSFLAPAPLLMYRFRTSAHGVKYDVENVGDDMRAALQLVFSERPEPEDRP